jgi:hypothetical protein
MRVLQVESICALLRRRWKQDIWVVRIRGRRVTRMEGSFLVHEIPGKG